MSTHRITIDLQEDSYRLLQQSIEAGEYRNESEAIEHMLTGLLFERIPEPGENPEYDKRLKEEIEAAVAEYEANPEDVYTGEEVLAYLAEQRQLRQKEAHAQSGDLLRKSAQAA